MRIKQILRQSRRDFEAIYECEHCGYIENGYGYDDTNFHQNVIPTMTCTKCRKGVHESYKPLATKYPDGFQI